MPAGKPEQTPEQRALRLRAYELFLSTDEGKRRSLRSIAMTLGVTLHTVQYWRKTDEWDRRLDQNLKTQTAAAGASGQAIAALLRENLYRHIGSLDKIINDANTKPSDRIRAIGELADIAHKLKVVDPRDLESPKDSRPLDFKDDLGEPHGPSPESISDVQHDELPAGSHPHDHHDDPTRRPGGGGVDSGSAE